MSTIASPRDSSSVRSPSSSRTSLDIPAAPRSQAGSQRRNRAALRDYYNLKVASEQASEQSPSSEQGPSDTVATSELDKEGFDAAAYVKAVLAKESLEGVLRIEGDLISEIKNLDGERKALVYDNYSKLIAATDTIRRMRMNMDPLTPATSTLSPAVSHIAETAASLSKELVERTSKVQINGTSSGKEDARQSQKQTVRWVLDTPRRIQEHMDNEDKSAAEAEYSSVKSLLESWQAVPGAAELKERCETLLLED